MSERYKTRLILGLILILALGLRVAYVLASQASPYFEQPVMDPLYHLQWARAFAGGEDHLPGPFFRAPLYPWFLGSLIRFLGENLLVIRLVQAGLGTLTTGLGFLLARRFFDARVALLSAFLIATNWVLIYFDGELLIPTLSIPLNLAALILTSRLVEAPSSRNAGLAGFGWGMAAIARPNVLLFLPALVGWLLWRARPRWRNAVTPCLALAAGTLAIILPLTTYNVLVGGDRVLISSQAGVNLWIGNNPASDGSSAIVPGTRPGWWEGYEDSIALAEQAEGHALKPSGVSAHYTGRALDFLQSSPGAALSHMLWKLRLFWTDWELGNNADVRFFATHYSPWMGHLPSRFVLLAPLALLGLLACRRSASRLFPLWGFVLIYTGSVVLFFVCARFRAPLLPLFAILASHTLVSFWDMGRAGQFKALGLRMAGALVLGTLMLQMPQGLDTTRAMGLWALGTHELGEGHNSKAQDYFRAALEENPRNLYATRDLGRAHQQAGELLEATETYVAALQLKQDDFPIRSSLVDVLIARGDIKYAMHIANRGVETSPEFAQVYDALARVYIARKEWTLATTAIHQGLQRDPQNFLCNMRLGALLLQQGQACDAVPYLEQAMDPEHSDAQQREMIQPALQQARQICLGR